MDLILSLLASLFAGGGGGCLVFFLLKASIQHEYSKKLESYRHELSQKLEDHKSELNSKMTSRMTVLSHELQSKQLKKSLFFEHHRQAFAEILSCIANLQKGLQNMYELTETKSEDVFSFEALDVLMSKFNCNQLFLDSSSIIAIETLIFRLKELLLGDIITIEHIAYGDISYANISTAKDYVEYLHPKIAELFQHKMELISYSDSHDDIVSLGSILLLNLHRFDSLDLPSALVVNIHTVSPALMVARAKENRTLLIEHLGRLNQFIVEHGITPYYHVFKHISSYLDCLRPRTTLRLTGPSFF